VAKRRKVSNMLALAVLGTVIAKPMHPYEMAATIREYGKDRDMPIKWGSLYTVVQNLEKHGFLTVVESSRQGGRPERTVYAITDAGRAELIDWVRELIELPEREQPRFEAGLSLLAVLGPDESIRLLRERVAATERQVAEDRAQLAASASVPRLFLIEGEYDLAMREAELAWVRGLLAELENGTLPDIERWRAVHEGRESLPGP
jgi:DNA-binding PadR family transcriptional regulator